MYSVVYCYLFVWTGLWQETWFGYFYQFGTGRILECDNDNALDRSYGWKL